MELWVSRQDLGHGLGNAERYGPRLVIERPQKATEQVLELVGRQERRIVGEVT